MNRNERDRFTIMAWVKQRALTLVAAAGLLGLGYRQAKRVWPRYQTQGEARLAASATCRLATTSSGSRGFFTRTRASAAPTGCPDGFRRAESVNQSGGRDRSAVGRCPARR